MRLHRFYIEQVIPGKSLQVESEELVHQWRNVFRYTVGGQVILFFGDGYDYLCMISQMGKRTAEMQVISRKKAWMPKHAIGAAISLIKKDNFELCIQKLTELGVSHVFPIISERSEKKSLNMNRAKTIAIEASEQSGRGDVITIYDPCGLEAFLESQEVADYDGKIVFEPEGESFQPLAYTDRSVLFAIGPEGGFSENEIKMFVHKDFKREALGELTLRAETAAISAAALINFG